MALFRFLVAITGLLGFGHQLVFAFPTVSPDTLVARDVACDDISMYTTQFFLDNAINQPGKNCLFYTGPWMKSAIAFARTEGTNLRTVWDIWDCKYYYNGISDFSNPLQCIFNDQTKAAEYFANMSRAMAMLCDAIAWLMTDDPKNIGQDGVWGQVEQPTLMLTGNIGGQVEIIAAIDTQGNSETTIWERYNEAVAGFNASTKRDGKASYCFTPEQLTAWFGGINW